MNTVEGDKFEWLKTWQQNPNDNAYNFPDEMNTIKVTIICLQSSVPVR